MHIETLKIFCDLAQLRSFSKSAEKHHLSQSAISQQLAQLELEHKCQLINRKKRPIELTKEGHVLHKASKDIIERYEQLRNDLNTLKSTSGRRINVAAIFSIGMHALPAYVKKFMMKYPDVNVHIEYMNADKIYDQILSGDADVGLVAIPKRDKRIEVFEFENEPLVFVCSPKHSFANEKQIDIHKVQFERFIGFERNVPSRTWIDSVLERFSISVRPVMEFDNIETIKRAVEINSGVSILPETTIIQEIKNKTLRAIPFMNEKMFRPTGIIIHKGNIFGQAGKYFIDLLRKKEK